MRIEIQKMLQERPDLLSYVREQPYWYRLLSREPMKIYEIEKHSKMYYGQTFPQKVGRFNEQLQMISMLISLARTMGQTE